MQWRRVRSEVSTSCQHSATLMAAGTSTATCLPCSMAYTAMGTWFTQSVAIYIRSISVALAKLLVCLIAYIALGLGEACTLEDSLALVDIRLLKVAKSLDLDALQMRETLHGTPGRACRGR